VLCPHADDVATALSGIEQERERQPRAGSYGMASLKLRDLGIGPAMVAAALNADGLHVARWIIGA
jgi:hypothetical protein